MRDRRRVSQYVPAAAAALLYAVLTLLGALTARSPTSPAWRGYSTLLVSGGIDLDEVIARLERGLPRSDIVSAATSTVSVSVVPRREDVVVRDLALRFDPLDPRWDPYMRKLDAMFHASGPDGPVHVIYLRAWPTTGVLALRVAPLMRGIEGTWSMPDTAPRRRPLMLGAALLFLAALGPVYRAARTRLFLALAAVPWLLGCLLGDLADLAVFYLVFPFCASLLADLRLSWPVRGRLGDLRGPRNTALATALLACTVCAALGVLFLGGSMVDATRLLSSLGADGALLGFAVGWGGRASSSHRVFVPVAIGRRLHLLARGGVGAGGGAGRAARRLVSSVPGPWAVAALAVVCLSPALFLVGGRSALTPAVPAPVAGSGRPSWDTLRSLWISARDDALPNLADYVAHEAYQGALAWGGTYDLPTRDAELWVPHYTYRLDPPSVVADRHVVARYTDRWLRATLAAAKPGTVGALLERQDRAARVRVGESAVGSLGSPSWRVAMVFGMVGLALLLGGQYIGDVLAPGGAWSAVGRRRQMEA